MVSYDTNELGGGGCVLIVVHGVTHKSWII